MVVAGVFQGALAISGIAAGMEKDWKGKLRISIGLIGNAFYLYMILLFEPFRIVLEVTETASIFTYFFYLIIGSIIIMAGFLFGHLAKENNVIIKMFKQLSTKSSQ